MNDGTCPGLEELERLGRLPAGDPGRAHIDHCTRCRAELLALADFLAPTAEGLPAGEWREVEAELLRRRERDRLAPARTLNLPPPPQPARRFDWRPAFAIAATLAVVLGVWSVRAPHREARLRGLGDAEWRPAVAERAHVASLSWSSVPGADRYRVELFDGALNPLATLEAGNAQVLRLAADSLPAAVGERSRVLAQVIAMHGPDVVQTSQSVTVRLR